MNKRTFNITVKLCSSLYPEINSRYYLSTYFRLYNKCVSKHGLLHTIKILKQMRLHITRYLCGNPLLVNTLKIGIDSSGWPKALSSLKELADGTLAEKKLLLTIVTLTRSIVLNKNEREKIVPDYDSITKPGIIKKIIPTGFIKEFVSNNRLKETRPEFEERMIYLSNKAGPIGKATLTAMHYLYSYSYDLMAAIFKLTDQAGIDYFSRSYK
jgi:hypothetical protein